MPTAVELAPSSAKGLEGVVANQSAICYVFGAEGRLIYRGYDIHDLADHSTFEETAYLLLHGDLPTRDQLKTFGAAIKASQKLPKVVQRIIKEAPLTANPMNVLRTAVSASVFVDPDKGDDSAAAEHRKAIRLIAQLPTMVALFQRLRDGQRPLAPRRGLNLAANYLYMMSGALPDPEAAKALDVALILHADHELNASTFAARVIAATLADMHGSPRRGCAGRWRRSRKSWGSGTACTAPRTRARRTCGACPRSWGARPASRTGSPSSRSSKP